MRVVLFSASVYWWFCGDHWEVF